MRLEPQPIFPIRAEHGEGPVWDPITQQLYWVDILQGKYYRGAYPSGAVSSFTVGQPLGVLALRAGGGLVLAVRGGFGWWTETGNVLTMLPGAPEAGNPEVRFNDGAVDPAGRFFAGTMSWTGEGEQGKLYRLDPDGRIREVAQELTISNGLGWSPDRRTFFLTDTLRHVIYAYDYDLATGQIANQRPFLHFSEEEFPDGITIDSAGGCWVALWGKARIARFDAGGRRREDIALPVLHPTSCCFGGPDLTTLFITTSQVALTDRQKWEYPLAGRVFAVETDVRGQVQPRFAG